MEDGTLIARSRYEVSYESQLEMRLNLQYRSKFWRVVVSRQPLKLWISDRGDGSEVAVFSALP